MLSLLFSAYLLQAAYMNLSNDGQRLLEQGDIKQAETVLKQSVASNPSHVPALKALAEVNKRLRRFPEAIELYIQVLHLNPGDVVARGELAELYSWIGNHDKSIVTYTDALELDPKNLHLKTGLARVFRWSHRYDEAERLYKDVLKADPENHEALKGLAEAYSMTGNLALSVEAFNKALELYPEDPELHKEKGTVLAWQKDFKDAISELVKAISLSPDYTDAYRTLGDVYSWMRSYPQAAEAYKKAADMEPSNLDNYLLLARLYMQSGKKDLAEASIKTALRIDPADSRSNDLLRELRGSDGHQITRRIGDGVELAAFAFVLILLMLAHRSKRRMLLRRHRLYFYMVNYTFPALVVFLFSTFLAKDYLARWLDSNVIEDFSEAFLFLTLGSSLLALLWTEHRSRQSMKTVILAIGAHPDDIELGCGGYIMKAKDSGAKVYGLTMTRGEKGADSAGRREEELKKAAKFMELDGFWVLDLPDTCLKDTITGMKDAIEEKIKEVGATVVLTHTPIDIHSDHQAVFEATKVAARNVSVFCYEDVSTPREFVPNYYCDLAGYIDDKMRLITFHKTQGAKTYMDPEVIKGRAAHRGLQCGMQYAEAFRIHKFLR